MFRTPLCHVTEPVLAPDEICPLALWSVSCVRVCRSAVVSPPPSLLTVPGTGPQFLAEQLFCRLFQFQHSLHQSDQLQV